MATTKNPTSSCSSSIHGWTYDVFISFRGKDTRLGFTGYLYKALREKGINTFIDDEELEPGAEITPTLVKAIQESRIALVIFSKNYASSTFCLEELVMIVECSKDKGMWVWPVFYHVDPADVRHQRGSYAEALANHEARFEEKIEKWRAALKKAADRSGSHFRSDGYQYEHEFIEKITQQVSKKINGIPLDVANYQVGLESRVQKVRLKEEQEEKEEKRMEKAEAHLFTIIKVARDADLYEQIGKDIFFELVDHDKVRSFWIRKKDPFIIFKEEVAREFGIPVMYQRFWLWAKRRNHTCRPYRPLTPQEETQPVGQLREVSKKANNTELKLYLEMEIGQGFWPIPPPEKSKEDLLLFFKLYDPSHEMLRYIGRFHVKASGKPRDILTRLNEMAGFAIDEEIELFEEITFEPHVMCEHVDKNSSFRASQLEDGDIICFQKAFKVGSGEQYRYPDVPSFLEYVYNRQIVRFRFLEKPKEDELSLNSCQFSPTNVPHQPH